MVKQTIEAKKVRDTRRRLGYHHILTTSCKLSQLFQKGWQGKCFQMQFDTKSHFVLHQKYRHLKPNKKNLNLFNNIFRLYLSLTSMVNYFFFKRVRKIGGTRVIN
jgi:hypothetical protein